MGPQTICEKSSRFHSVFPKGGKLDSTVGSIQAK